MFPGAIAYLAELPAHDTEIDAINDGAFGPGRFARAAYKIREGGPHDRRLSFVAMAGDQVVGSVRLTPIAAGEGRGHMLGPLAVRPAFKSAGIGRTLVALSLDAARIARSPLVMLVGDAPYYGPLGFVRVPFNQVEMPRPVDPSRLLACEFVPGSLARLRGALDHVDRIIKPAAAPIVQSADKPSAEQPLRAAS